MSERVFGTPVSSVFDVYPIRLHCPKDHRVKLFQLILAVCNEPWAKTGAFGR